MNRITIAMTVVFLFAILLITIEGVAPAQTNSCDPAGKWIRDDKIQTIEIYRSESKLFGKLLSSSEKGEKPGFQMLRDFVYDSQKSEFRGTLIVPSSGREASGELVCTSDNSIRITGRKLFISKTFSWTRSPK